MTKKNGKKRAPRRPTGTGSLTRRYRPDGTEYPGWHARWRDEHGRLCKKQIKRSKTDASAWLAEELARVRRVRLNAVAVMETTLERALPHLLRRVELELSPRSLELRTPILTRIAEILGAKLVERVTADDLRRALDQMAEEAKGWAPTTWNAGRAYLSKAFEHLREMGHLGAGAPNPARQLKARKTTEEAMRFLDPEEYARLLSHCPPEIRDVLRVYRWTGARRNEALKLRWDNVKGFLGEGVVTVVFEYTKSGKPRAVPTLGPDLREAFRRRWESYGPDGPPADAPVFQDVKESRLGAWFQRARKRAGLDKVTPHDLRATFCVSLEDAGVTPTRIQRLMGHSKLAMTERYLNARPRKLDVDAAELLLLHFEGGRGAHT